jgi:hypothetical protein
MMSSASPQAQKHGASGHGPKPLKS